MRVSVLCLSKERACLTLLVMIYFFSILRTSLKVFSMKGTCFLSKISAITNFPFDSNINFCTLFKKAFGFSIQWKLSMLSTVSNCSSLSSEISSSFSPSPYFVHYHFNRNYDIEVQIVNVFMPCPAELDLMRTVVDSNGDFGVEVLRQEC